MTEATSSTSVFYFSGSENPAPWKITTFPPAVVIEHTVTVNGRDTGVVIELSPKDAKELMKNLKRQLKVRESLLKGEGV